MKDKGVEGVDWWWNCSECEYSLSKEDGDAYYCHICGIRYFYNPVDDTMIKIVPKKK